MFRYITLTILAASAAALVAPRSPETTPPPVIVTEPPGSALTNEQIVEIYAANEKEIAAIWLTLGEDATMRTAVENWLKRRKEPTPAVGQPQPVATTAPAADAISAQTPAEPAAEVSAATHPVSTPTKACECPNCTCDPCTCGPGVKASHAPERVPHYRSTTAGWVPCKMLTAQEAAALNAAIMRATQPAMKPPVQAAPVTMYSAPVILSDGDCANGRCNTSGRFFRRWKN